MNKRTMIPLIVTTILAMSSTSSAESIERAPPDDLQMLLSAASGENSAYWATYIGETRERVYIEYETAIHSSSFITDDLKLVVFWLPRSEITDDQLRQFKEYKEKFKTQR